MTTTSALGAVRSRWWIILLLAVVGAGLGALPQPSKVAKVSTTTTTYTATDTLLINNSDSIDPNNSGNTLISPNQVTLFATRGDVPKNVATKIKFSGNPAELAAQVTVAFDQGQGSLTFTTTQDTAAQAELIANTFGDETNKFLVSKQQALREDQITSVQTRLDDLKKQLTDITNELAASPGDPTLTAQQDAISRQYSTTFEQNDELSATPNLLSFSTLESAQAVPVVQSTSSGGLSAPSSRPVRALLGLIVGLALGVALAILLGRIDRKIRTRDQAEGIFGMRARVLIPKIEKGARPEIIVRNERHDPLTDAYRTVRNVIGFVQASLEPVDRARITVIVSPGPAEGKTSLAANLSAAFVETGQRTIAVNTDFRRPRLAGAVTVGPRVHLPFVLDEVETLDPEWLLTETVDPNLSLLDLSTLGTPGELARATARVLPQLSHLADAIVIDTSPVGATAEVLELVPHADVIVIVSRLGQSAIAAAERTIAILKDVSTAPMLLVLTGASAERSTYYEYGDRRRSNEHRTWRNGFRKYTGPERRRPENARLRKTTELELAKSAADAKAADKASQATTAEAKKVWDKVADAKAAQSADARATAPTASAARGSASVAQAEPDDTFEVVDTPTKKQDSKRAE
ncbi:MAG TPA: hypothetical protein VGM78_04770 [Ilumatobacteraceae bacterium]